MIFSDTTRDRARSHDGWSMIEVVITILVIALVAAYAIPKLLGPRDSANDGTAKTSLRAAMTAAETEFAQKQSYEGLDAARLHELEPSIKANDDLDPGVRATSVPIGRNADAKIVTTMGSAEAFAAEWGAINLCAASKSGNVYCVKLVDDDMTHYYTIPAPADWEAVEAIVDGGLSHENHWY